MNQNPKPSEIIIMASGAVVFIFSFLNWIEFNGSGESAWGSGIFPAGAFVALFGLVMAAQVALDRFANVDFPDEVAGFTWPQIHLVLAVFAALVVFSFLIIDKRGADIGIGLILSLLGAAGLVVGAVMLANEDSGSAGGPAGPAGPPQSF